MSAVAPAELPLFPSAPAAAAAAAGWGFSSSSQMFPIPLVNPGEFRNPDLENPKTLAIDHRVARNLNAVHL